MGWQCACAALGLFLMAAPGLFGYGGLAADLHHIVGPLVASCAVIAVTDITRPVRWANVGFGVALMMLPAAFQFATPAELISVAVGVLLLGLSPWGGGVTQKFDGGWMHAWRVWRRVA